MIKMESFAFFCCLFAISAAVVLEPPCGGCLSSGVVDAVPEYGCASCLDTRIPEPVVQSPCGLPTYRVSLDNCGPRSKPAPVVSAPTVSAKPVEVAPVTLPFKVPAVKTVSNRCRCVKTILKPQIVQQEIVVPVIRKYVQTLARPALQTINYDALPVNCPVRETYGSALGCSVC